MTTAAATLPWFAMTRLREDAAVHAAARGDAEDTERVEQLYARLEGKLTNVVYRWLWNREEARDVLQEAFVRLWQMRERVDWDRVEPLIYRIALNLAAKRRRSQRVWRLVGLAQVREPEAAVDADALTAEQEAAVRREIDALPERQRRVLVLAIHGELSYAQIADVLGISIGTVASRRNTAVASLRAALERWERER